MTFSPSAERIAPLCASGILAEFVAGIAGYYGVAAVWPNSTTQRLRPGTLQAVQKACEMRAT